MKISIIVPAYNTEKYIQRCVDSILDRTFRDFELIIVDDGSTDHTSEIINGYAADNIRYIKKQNGGVDPQEMRGCRNQFLRDSEVLTDKDRAYFDSVSDHMSEAEATISLHRMCDFRILVS